MGSNPITSTMQIYYRLRSKPNRQFQMDVAYSHGKYAVYRDGRLLIGDQYMVESFRRDYGDDLQEISNQDGKIIFSFDVNKKIF